jgi:N-acetylneuraminic acid mutarotase
LLSFGGVYDDFNTGNFTFYNDLRRFNPNTNTWTLLTPSTSEAPSVRMTTARAMDKRTDRFYIYGGTRYTSDFSEIDIFDDLWCYDIAENQWSLVAPQNSGPGPRTGAVMTLHGNFLYLFGGLDAYFGGKSDVWQFNTKSSRWTELIPNNRFAPRPTGMQYSPIHYYRGDLIIGSGEGGAETGFGFVNEWWTFNLATKTWTPFNFTVTNNNINTTYVLARNYMASALYAGKIFVYGGDRPSSETPCCGAPYPQSPTNETWVLNLDDSSWALLDSATSSTLSSALSLKRHLGDLLDDKFYVVGGWEWNNNGVGQIWNSNTLVLDLDDVLNVL